MAPLAICTVRKQHQQPTKRKSPATSLAPQLACGELENDYASSSKACTLEGSFPQNHPHPEETKRKNTEQPTKRKTFFSFSETRKLSANSVLGRLHPSHGSSSHFTFIDLLASTKRKDHFAFGMQFDEFDFGRCCKPI